MALTAPGSAIPKETVLYNFGSVSGDGSQPNGVIIDSSGNLWGTTVVGGAGGEGTLFKLVPGNGGYTETILYSFCSLSNCTDGSRPYDQLIMDTSGDVYGVTLQGGKFNAGSVFELTGKGKLITLYSFCAKTACADGNEPTVGLTYDGAQSGTLYDGTSALYGVTFLGGKKNLGTVYELTYVTGKNARAEHVLHAMCIRMINGACDGAYPQGRLIFDSKGHMFGLSSQGGQHGSDGLAYELLYNTIKAKWGYKIIYVFNPGAGDGFYPVGALVQDSSGILYGVTSEGDPCSACGTLFQLNPKTKAEKVLYAFCSQQNCTDGSSPNAGPSLDSNGNLFGITSGGGKNGNDGIVFKYSSGVESTVYNFCNLAGCSDGGGPVSGVALDTSGDIFGATCCQGAHNAGVIYEITGAGRETRR